MIAFITTDWYSLNYFCTCSGTVCGGQCNGRERVRVIVIDGRTPDETHQISLRTPKLERPWVRMKQPPRSPRR